jgi:hypothetical protein
MDASQSGGGHTSEGLGLQMLAWTILLAIAPLRSAHAYIDPNSVGPLYQILFPLVVAIGSATTALRRRIKDLWVRLKGSDTTGSVCEADRADSRRNT